MVMASEGVSITTDTGAPFLSVAVASQAAQARDSAAAPATVEPVDKPTSKTLPSEPVDTVVISNQVQKASQEPRAEEAAKKETDKQVRKPESGGRTMGHVLFEYNVRGDLRIRFMDSKNMLIYQIPPVMVAKTMDLMKRFSNTVNMKA
jgi:hypothetical protein